MALASTNIRACSPKALMRGTRHCKQANAHTSTSSRLGYYNEIDIQAYAMMWSQGVGEIRRYLGEI